jgi:hypothetical protein
MESAATVVLTEVRTVNSVVSEADISISMARPDRPRLIALRVGYAHYNLFAGWLWADFSLISTLRGRSLGRSHCTAP